MSKLDPMVRSKAVVDFCTNIIPAGAQTALTLMQIGQPFNLQRYYTQVAFDMGIQEIVEDLLDDPEFQQKLGIMMLLGPQNPGKAQTGSSIEGAKQNKGNPQARPILTPQQDFNTQSQESAAMAQSINYGAVQ